MSLGVTSAEIPVNSPLDGSTIHDLDGGFIPGATVGLAVSRLRCDAEGDGGYIEVGTALHVWGGRYDRESTAGVSSAATGDMPRRPAPDSGDSIGESAYTWQRACTHNGTALQSKLVTEVRGAVRGPT